VSDGIGPFGTAAVSTAVLAVEIGFALALVVGQLLVRRGHVRVHAYLQSTIVLANLPIVALWMLPSYLTNVAPGLPGELAEPFYLFPTLMLIVGATVEALGVYVLLVAGTNLVPERFRFRRYKLWMRAVVVLWWSVLLAGIATYYVWYVSATGAS
jgi:uncharacterized membrane protein YozB (DUF420 family)